MRVTPPEVVSGPGIRTIYELVYELRPKFCGIAEEEELGTAPLSRVGRKPEIHNPMLSQICAGIGAGGQECEAAKNDETEDHQAHREAGFWRREVTVKKS